MPFDRQIGQTILSVVRGDITQLQNVDVIVNAANERCLGGGGVDGAIHRAAGPQLLAECQLLPEVAPGVRCQIGRAVITNSGDLRNIGIQKIIHTVGPDMRQHPVNPEALLRSAYWESLALAEQNGLRKIAFPSISTGIYGYPFEAGTRLAIQTVHDYLQAHPNSFDRVNLIFLNDQQQLAAGNLL